LSRLARDLHKKRLRKGLAAAQDEEFFELIWAANALQTGRETAATKILGRSYSVDAATDDMASPHAIYKWELETLVNETLTIPKQDIVKKNHTKSLNTKNYASITTLVNYLRKLEEQEYIVFGGSKDILKEMYRIAGRQFDWQRGYFNVPLFYRSAYIYGQGRCSDYLKSAYGTSLAEMSLVGFALHTATSEFPAFAPNLTVESVGLDSAALGRVLKLISRPIQEIRKIAAEQRSPWQMTAYRPSVLRRFPCISFRQGTRFLCPLPELILERVTSGVFYDVIGGPGEIRNEYGHRFEEYALKYIQAQLPALEAAGEWSYRADKQNIDTPDIIVSSTKTVTLAIECKASRMSFAARFSERADTDRGYDDIVKGVFQIWRFFSHCRRGLTGVEVDQSSVGMLLTLDSWLVMGGPITKDILRRAREMVGARDERITEEDRKPIVFCPITDLESVLADADEQSFVAAVLRATDAEHDGWMLSSIHKEVAKKRPRKQFPFDDLADLLPWWGMLEEAKSKAKKGG
jgi:hypothetical protein